MCINIPDRFKLAESKKQILIIRKDYEKHVDFFQNNSICKFEVEGNDSVCGRLRHRIICLTNESIEKFVVRNAKRGGIMRFFLNDVFINYHRPISELFISEYALQNNINTPEIIAIKIYKLYLPYFYKFALITMFIPDSIQLRDYIIKLHQAKKNFLRKKRKIIKKLSDAIKNMHNKNILHGDLHIRNIIVKQDVNEEIYFVDFDKSILKDRLNEIKRLENIARLYRSVLKDNNIQNNITRQDKLFFLKEYLAEDYTKEKSRKVINFVENKVYFHKLFWKIFGKK